MTAITQYYAKVGLRFDPTGLKRVDAGLKAVEKKLIDFQKRLRKSNGALNIRFNFSTTRLQADVQRAFIEVGRRVRFPVDNFVVNRQGLATQITSAIRQAINSANRSITLTPRVAGAGFRQPTQTTQTQRSPASFSRANFLHAGGAGGAIARYGFGALPFVGGAMGVTQLNQANQNLVSANISAQAVLGEQAKPRLDWLSKRADYLGVNFADTLPQFTKFMASASPLLGGDAAQETFGSFMQFGRTRGATKVSMNRALNAVAQMGAKGQIMQEELKSQLAEASGFGELPQLFAEAYQIQTGGALKGPEARAVLMKAMEDGLVKADILPIVSGLMNELSQGSIEQARTSSMAEQARAENALTGRTGLLALFSKSGGEQAFAKFFRIMADGLKANEPLVRGLTDAFGDLVTFMEAPLQLVKDFNTGLTEMSTAVGLSEGALVKLGGLGVMLATKWGRIGLMFATIAAVLQDISRGIQGKESYTKNIVDWVGANSTSVEERKVNPNDPLGRKGPLADLWQNTVRPGINQFADNFSASMERSRTISDPNSVYFNDPKGYDTMAKERAAALALEAKSSTSNTTVTFGDINVTMPAGAEGADDSQRAQMFANMLQHAINEALPNFNTTQ